MLSPNSVNWPLRLSIAFQPYREHFGMESEFLFGESDTPIMVRVVDKSSGARAYFRFEQRDLNKLGATSMLTGVMHALVQHLRSVRRTPDGYLQSSLN